MTRPITVLKSCGPKLVPFFKTCTIFFVLFTNTPASESSQPWFFCVVKCLPIISLIFFVLLHGMNLTEYYRYSRRILIGLVFSCLGDACLVWKQSYFELGIGCFAIAQISYARAFGWKPLNPIAGAIFFGVGCIIFTILSTALKGIMVYMVALYVTVICTMAWRAVARVQTWRLFDEVVTWTNLSGCFGAIAFVISDMVLAFDKFLVPIPHAHPIIMLTYYAAQLGITLSVVDSPLDELMASSRKDQDHVLQEKTVTASLQNNTTNGMISKKAVVANGNGDTLLHNHQHSE